MQHPTFTTAAVARALADRAVAQVDLVAQLPASAAEVARLCVRFSDGRPPRTVIGKAAAGAARAALQRELRFYAELAPRWAHPAPALLGATVGDGDPAPELLVLEDLAAAGYALLEGAPTQAQLHAAIDGLVAMHAAFWDAPALAQLDDFAGSVTRAAQALPLAAIDRHARELRDATAPLLADADARGDRDTRALIEALRAAWPRQFAARARAGGLTLLHGDYHLLGNLFFAPSDPRPRAIDWSEAKPGLGPHDVAYLLFAAPSDDRPARDGALLRRYWEGLVAAGITGYSWARCAWDFQLSILTNLFQAAFQQSAYWFARTAAVAAVHGCRAALETPPPA